MTETIQPVQAGDFVTRLSRSAPATDPLAEAKQRIIATLERIIPGVDWDLRTDVFLIGVGFHKAFSPENSERDFASRFREAAVDAAMDSLVAEPNLSEREAERICAQFGMDIMAIAGQVTVNNIPGAVGRIASTSENMR